MKNSNSKSSNSSNIDILYTTYNTPQELLHRSLECLQDIDNFILIVDDCSTQEYYNHLIEYCAELNIKNYAIVQTPENGGQYNATNFGLDILSNDYIIRLDDDDTYTNIPNSVQGDKDIYSSRNTNLTLDDWFQFKNAQVTGIIIRRSIMKVMYSSLLKREELNYFHEDVYAFLVLLLTGVTLSMERISSFYQWKDRRNSNVVPHQGKPINRKNLLFYTCMKQGIDSNDYKKLIKRNTNG